MCFGRWRNITNGSGEALLVSNSNNNPCRRAESISNHLPDSLYLSLWDAEDTLRNAKRMISRQIVRDYRDICRRSSTQGRWFTYHCGSRMKREGAQSLLRSQVDSARSKSKSSLHRLPKIVLLSVTTFTNNNVNKGCRSPFSSVFFKLPSIDLTVTASLST